MDDMVLAALAKWPGVPHVRGWLGFDTRGHWYLRDERTQAAGPFPVARGDRLEHEGLLAFIGRNHDVDAAGCWFFQNGPQRVYIELEVAPFVWRLQPPTGPDLAPAIVSSTGHAASPRSAWLDEDGRCYLLTDLGFGLVHTMDTVLAADAVERGTWALAGTLPADAMPARFQYVLSPQRQAAQR